jgi:GNAT superfamily N-acetyltransferase
VTRIRPICNGETPADAGARAEGAPSDANDPARDPRSAGDETRRSAKAARTPRASRPAAAPPAVPFEFRREPVAGDLERVRELLTATGYFYPAEVKVALELLEDRIEYGAESEYFFLFAEDGGRLAGYTCYGPISCTASSFDLFWIAVRPDLQGRGLGRALLEESERLAAAAGGTRIYAETSTRPLYDSTRAFYERCGYALGSVLEDFYAPGDGKATYVKVLGPKPAAAPGKRGKRAPARGGKAP